MTGISSNRDGISSLVLPAVIVLAIGGAVGALVGGMNNPFLLFLAISGLFVLIVLLKNIEWGLLALVFINFTMISEVLVDTHGLPSISKFLVFLLALLILARWAFQGESPEGAGPAFLLLVAYGLVTTLSLLYAVDYDSTMDVIYDYIKNAIIVIVIVLILKRGDALRHVTYAILAGAIFLGTLSAYQYLTGTFDNRYGGFAVASFAEVVGKENSYRLTGPVGDPNFFGQLLLFALPLAIERLKNEKATFWRLVAAYALVVLMLSIAFTFSRGTFLAVVVILLLMLVRNPPRPAVLVAIFASGAAALVLFAPDYVERMFMMLGTVLNITGYSANIQDEAIRGRLGEMQVALAAFFDHPLLGLGAGNYEHYYQHYSLALDMAQRGEDRAAHSLYLELAAERGLLGLTAYFLFTWYVFRTILGSIRRLVAAGITRYAELAAAYGYALLGYLLTSIFLHDTSRFYWVLLGIVLSLPAVVSYEIDHAAGRGRDTADGAEAEDQSLIYTTDPYPGRSP